MNSAQQLKNTLLNINRKSYPAYKSLTGSYQFPGYTLVIDHVQGDPFASPSKIHLEIPEKTAGFPAGLYDTYAKRIALQDHLTRLLGREISKVTHKASGSGKSGLISISRCGQEILERSCCCLQEGTGRLIIRLEVGFPANGRTINSPELIQILFDFLPQCVQKSLIYKNLKAQELLAVAQLCENQEAIRKELAKRNLTAFVANGSILPRSSGVSHQPLKEAVPFASPDSLAVTLEPPHGGAVTGMGIPRGITLIVGGGFHGKSTLLKALEMGVYNHIAGDGREYVITDRSACKLRSEDSRYIDRADISLFINHLPSKSSTQAFSTLDASGSTSQAANVVEGIESGSRLFLIDEDTSATNFMIRDELMQRVVADSEEPITPFISRVRSLYDNSGISSILVAGSSGAYFHVADRVLQMKEYEPFDITERAKQEAAAFSVLPSTSLPYVLPEFKRFPKASKNLTGSERIKIKTTGTDGFQINKSTTDLRYLEQLADSEQLSALAYLLSYSARHLMNGKRSLQEIVDLLEQQLDQRGLESLSDTSYLPANLCRPRRQEIFSCFNRCRELTF